jgi:circadian clock protein KaiC
VIDEQRPTVLIIDPISSLIKSGGKAMVDSVVQLLVDFIKVRGITGILTALVDSDNPEQEVTLTHVSTIADTWLHLTFVANGGERNRALTVIKSRGSAHSHQVRELVLSSAGPTLADVYTEGGIVLMGTARLEREADAATRRSRDAYDIFTKRSGEAAAIEEARGRIAALEAEVQGRTKALALLDELEAKVTEIGVDRMDAVRRSRSADAGPQAQPPQTQSQGREPRI